MGAKQRKKQWYQEPIILNTPSLVLEQEGLLAWVINIGMDVADSIGNISDFPELCLVFAKNSRF